MCAQRRVAATIAATVFAAAAFGAAPARAAGWSTFPVDDSMSQVQGGPAALRWRQALPTRAGSHLLDATVEVRIVLNVAPWVGKPARIYMVMPPLAQSSLSVQWLTAGTLLPGRLTGGQRQLVFQGVVPGARLEDSFRVTAVADARDAASPPRVNFTFEIEVASR